MTPVAVCDSIQVRMLPLGGSKKPFAPAVGLSSSKAERVEALTKLKELLDSGVLTEEQYEAERKKLLQGT